MSSCRVCGRVLKDPVSIARGVGPTCMKGIRHVESAQRASSEIAPFDPDLRDIVCFRDARQEAQANIDQRHVDHSPSGFEWGYGGSGPADFALNILDRFEDQFPKVRVEDRARCWDGSTVHPDVWRLHQQFKTDFLIPMPRRGGTIYGSTIKLWIRGKLEVL